MYIRILLFYILGVTVIGLLVPYTDPDLNLKESNAAKSPFVIAIRHAGIKGLPSLINACLLTSAWSAASSDLYTSSRALCECDSRGSHVLFADHAQTVSHSTATHPRSSVASTAGVSPTSRSPPAPPSACSRT